MIPMMRHPLSVSSLYLGELKGLQTTFEAQSSDVSPNCSAARCHIYLSHTLCMRATNSPSFLQGHFLPQLCPCQLYLSSSHHPFSYSHHQSKQPPGKGTRSTPSFSFMTFFLSCSHGFLLWFFGFLIPFCICYTCLPSHYLSPCS